MTAQCWNADEEKRTHQSHIVHSTRASVMSSPSTSMSSEMISASASRVRLAFTRSIRPIKRSCSCSREICKCIIDRRGRDRRHGRMDALAALGQIDAVDAPIGRVGPPLDPALVLQAIDDASCRRLLDLHHVGKLLLAGAGPPM